MDDEDEDDNIQPCRPHIDDEDIGDAGQDDPPGDEGDSEHEDGSDTESLPLSVLEEASDFIRELESAAAEAETMTDPPDG